MFTGLIEATGRIVAVRRSGKEAFLSVNLPFEVEEGDSVAVDGACLTVTEFRENVATFFVSSETVERTVFSDYEVGGAVNLERPLKVGDRLHGHWVTGHVDGVLRIERVITVTDGKEVFFSLPDSFSVLVVEKGSVAINGISLTVASVRQGAFSVALIPETLNRTAFSLYLYPGRRVNVEFDIIGKYVLNAVKSRGGGSLEKMLEELL